MMDRITVVVDTRELSEEREKLRSIALEILSSREEMPKAVFVQKEPQAPVLNWD